MTTTAHRDCTHPATKTARATCRRDRAAAITAIRLSAGELIYSYYQGAEFEEVIYSLMEMLPEVKTAYFESDADPEEIIAIARNAKLAL